MQGPVTRVSRGKQMERCFNLVFTVTKNSETCVDKNLEWLSVGSQAQRYMLHKVVREPLLFRETISGQHKSSQLSFCSPLLETSVWTSLSKHLKTSSPPWVASLTAPERRVPSIGFDEFIACRAPAAQVAARGEITATASSSGRMQLSVFSGWQLGDGYLRRCHKLHQ